MKLEKIYFGTLYPRTKLHLRELYNFLKFKEFEKGLGFEAPELNKLHRSLRLKKIEYSGGNFDKIFAEFKAAHLEYFEDGLLILCKNNPKTAKEISDLRRFYNKKLSPVLGLIYSKGMPVSLSFSLKLSIKKHVSIFVLSQATETEVKEIFAGLKSKTPHASVINNGCKVYFAPEYIVIVAADFNSENCRNLIEHYIYFREYESQLHQYLNLNRIIWGNVDKILKKESVDYRDLPQIKEELLGYKEINDIIETRLNQMNNYLELRLKNAEHLKIMDFLNKYKADRFLKIGSIHEYMKKLWQTTDRSLASAIDFFDSVYQENIQRGLKALQAIFLIAVTASFLTMGAMPGADLTFFDQSGRLLATGQFVSFNFPTLLKFGATVLVISIILYFVWDFIYKILRKYKVVKLLKKPKRLIK